MGGKSTSNGAVLHSDIKSTSNAFDLRSWQGLTEVLRVGRESIKDARTYAEFRDLVLEYTQSGGDPEVKKKVEAVIKTFVSQKQGSEEIKPEVGKIPVPTQIPAPSAIDVKVVPYIKNNESGGELEISKKIHTIPRRPAPSFIPREVKRSSISVNEEKSKAPIKEIVTEKPTPDVEKVVEVEKVPEPVVEKELSLKDIADSSEQPKVHATMDEHKARISEIKRLVHEQVGNPASLMDTHNDAGKKYMVALLSALKATGAGSAIGIDTAMEALETASTNLLHDVGKVTRQVKPTPSENSRATVAEVAKPKIEMPVPQKAPASQQEAFQKQIRDIKLKPPAPRPTPSVPFPTPTIPRPTQTSTVKVEEKISVQIQKPVPSQNIPVRTPASAIAEARSVERESVVSKVAEAKLPPRPMPTAKSAQPEIQESEIPRSIPQVSPVVPVSHSTESTTSVVQQSELATPEISEALNSLLHEWTLFSGSGILGIGPSGADHPLYQKISRLSMGEVLAGRFERADAKVIRVIKEYVDAWRHEQGIAYTINETFEHYLRRVVQRILKRQS